MRITFISFIALLIATIAAAMPLKLVRLDHARAPFSPATISAAGFGGVLLQSEVESASREGEPIQTNTIHIASFDPDLGVCFKLEQSDGDLSNCYYFEVISDDYFARAFSYVNNDGWGAFSAFSDGDRFERDAGIILSSLGYTAIEFVGNQKLERIVHDIDFRELAIGIVAEDIPAQDAQAELDKLNEDREPGGRDLWYVIGDLTSGYHATFSGTSVSVAGSLRFYDRTLTANGRQVYYTSVLIYPDFESYDLALKIYPELTRDNYASYVEHDQLAHLLALLRTAQNQEKTWSSFLTTYFE